MNYFDNLLAVKCETDKKGKLTYVSWIEAWTRLKSIHPAASYEVHRTESGAFLHGEGMVMVSVTVPSADVADGEAHADVTHTMWLPVMDGRNQAIKNPDATQINKAVMRCLAKAIAMHGLGSYVYMGEDLPLIEPPKDFTADLDKLRAYVATADAGALARTRAKVAGWPERFQSLALEAVDARVAELDTLHDLANDRA